MTKKKERAKQAGLLNAIDHAAFSERLDNMEDRVGPLYREHQRREERRARWEANRRFVPRGPSPRVRIERRLDAVEEALAKRHSVRGLASRVDDLEKGADYRGALNVRVRTLELERDTERQRVMDLEGFRHNVVFTGYVAGLVGGVALVAYVARFVVALCG